jgi:C-terminal processing protease CtpA/Prc
VNLVKDPPRFRQQPGKDFWVVYLPDSHTLYCSFRGYRGLAENASALLREIKERRPEKLAIDLRQNGGGDYKQGLKYLIEPIQSTPEINRRGHLFVLIGVNTFSAAMSNAAQFRERTAAILVGEPIGERPNSYQEAREMRLPNSKLLVRYSTQYYEFTKGGENVIRPDQLIPTDWETYKAGRDPVLEWVLQYK